LACASRPVLGPISVLIQWVPGTISRGKAPGRETDHLSPPGAEVKNAWNPTSIPPFRCLNAVLKDKGDFIIFRRGTLLSVVQTGKVRETKLTRGRAFLGNHPIHFLIGRMISGYRVTEIVCRILKQGGYRV
jgi:hypothetical protein